MDQHLLLCSLIRPEGAKHRALKHLNSSEQYSTSELGLQAARMQMMEKTSRFLDSDDEDDIPLSARKKPKKETSAKKRKKADSDYDDDEEEDFKPVSSLRVQ